MEKQLSDLSSQIGKTKIKTDKESLSTYGKDWTNYFTINPSAIIFPENIQDVQNIVQWARKNKVPLVPSGGRTGLSGAACATQKEVVVSLEKMNRILNFDSVEHAVTLEPGVITEDLQNFAKEKNLYYPVDFASRGSSQIGGNIATNAGGIKVLRYGMTRNWITSLKVVTGTGELLEFNKGLVKNATGYDFRHLMIGSEGTLGFIVEATIQLAPTPPPTQTLLLAVPNLGSIMQIFSSYRQRTQISAFEMFSDKALTHVMSSTGLSQPFSERSPYYLVVEYDIGSETLESHALEAFEHCLENGWATDGIIAQSDKQAKDFWRFREDITEATSKYTPYKNDISVTVNKVPNFIEELDQLLNQNYPNWEIVWFGHIGDGNLHISILKPANLEKVQFLDECRKVDKLLFTTIKKYAGSISAEHGVGLTKKMFLDFTRSPMEIELMRQIKKLFDPDQILNPGKVF